MVVSYTFTIESTGGNGIVVPGWGFLLNNELTDFDFDQPDAPPTGPRAASARAARWRRRSSREHGKPLLAVGSPGGSMIITTVCRSCSSALELGKSLPEAIAAPRASQRNGATSIAEPAFMQTEAPALAARHGHAFGRRRPRSAPPPGSSSSTAGACSPPPSPSAAAAAARWWSNRSANALGWTRLTEARPPFSLR